MQSSGCWVPELSFNSPAPCSEPTGSLRAHQRVVTTMPLDFAQCQEQSGFYLSSPTQLKVFHNGSFTSFSKFCLVLKKMSKTTEREVHPHLARQQKQLQFSHLDVRREKRIIIYKLGLAHTCFKLHLRFSAFGSGRTK